MPDSAPDLGLPTPPSARALADGLYDFALTVTWDPLAAAESVRAGLDDPALGGDPLPAALYGAVRRAAVHRTRPADPETLEVTGELPPPTTGAEVLEALALGITDHLDPSDRAVLDLALRKGLEGDDLAVALGVPAHEVGELVAATRNRADRGLRNYVLARIGTDVCPRLREALEDVPPGLEALADRVDEHVADCAICDDRRRGLAAPTGLLTTIPERRAPDDVVEALADRTGAAGIDEQGPTRRWGRIGAIAGVVVIALAALVVGAQILGDDETPAVDEAPVGRLRAGASTVGFEDEATVRTVTITNTGERAVAYEVRTDVPWLVAAPPEGTIGRGESTEITLTLDRSAAPEGDSVTTVRIVSEGGILEVDVTATVSRNPVVSQAEVLPPQVSAAPCEAGTTTAAVRATVVEESGLRAVVIRWSGGTTADGATEGEIPMSLDGQTYTGSLGPFTGEATVTWTVVVTDTGGNLGESEPGTLTVTGECVPLDEGNE